MAIRFGAALWRLRICDQGKRIMTNAHVGLGQANQQAPLSRPQAAQAKVEFIGNDCDLPF
jgi:hypothetical protein